MTTSAESTDRSADQTLAPTRELCAWLAANSWATLPPEVLERARYLLLDGIACGFVGAQLPWARKAVAGTLNVDNGSGATLWGWGRQVSPLAAALLNGTFVQGFELDDFHPHGALHSSSVVVTAALAAAEERGRVGFEELLEALVLGYETGPRVGIAMGGARVTTRGWHTGAVFGPLAAAAAAGKVYGLDAAGFESALGNAGTRAGALMAAQYKSMVKRMHHGMAAQSGLHGAALARAGFLGIETVVEHEYGGMASTMLGEAAGEADLDALTRGLGEQWSMMDIGIKRHACLIMLHSTVDALIAERHRLDTAAVDRIVIEVGRSVDKRTNWYLEPPGSPLGAQMNLRYAAAVALLDGAAYVEQFTPDAIARPEVWRLMDRIDVVHSDRVDELGTERRFVTYVEVRLSDGSSIQLTGTPPQDRPFAPEDVVAKYRSLVGPLLEERRLLAIESLVLQGGASDDVATLVRLLHDEVPPALDLQETL